MNLNGAWIIWISTLFGCSHAARILVIMGSFSKSHHFVYRPVLRELAARGHNITYVSAIPWDDRPANVDQRLIDINPEVMFGTLRKDNFKPPDLTKEKVSSVQISKIYKTMFNIFVPTILGHPVVQALINSDDEYDMVISETMRGMEAFSAFAHRFNATNVVFLTRGDNSWPNELCGLPDNPAYMVDASSPFTDKMDFWQRLQNSYNALYQKILGYKNFRKHQEFVNTYFNDSQSLSLERPPVSRLVSDQALVLVNSHHSVGYAFPKAPHVKEVGGTHIPTPKNLPEELESRLKSTTHGLIYFSMGGNIDFERFNANKIINMFAGILSKRKEHIFWKGDNAEVKGKFDNIFQSSWFPQVDVLAHNKTKAFISHGGMLSIMEAVSIGVPIIGVPVFGDQTKNLLHAVSQGYALIVELRNLTEASLNWALDEVINNPKYKANALKQSKLFHDRPMKPVEEAVYWIEYVLRHGKVLQPTAALLPFYQLYLLDVIAVIMTSLGVTIFVGKKLIQSIVRRVRSLRKSATIKEKLS